MAVPCVRIEEKTGISDPCGPPLGDAVDEMYARGEIVRGAPRTHPTVPHEPLPGTPPSEEIVSEGRDED